VEKEVHYHEKSGNIYIVILAKAGIHFRNMLYQGFYMDSGLHQNDIESLFRIGFFVWLVFARRKDVFKIAL
jgi:hypothetical protein